MDQRSYSANNTVRPVRNYVLKYQLVFSTRIKLMLGLIDEGEKPETTAERELHEETGYYGKATHTSFLMYNGIAIS
jgi:8-oxo-dGTP pyrophosphatase MutT (NUDIX family)